MAFEVFDEGVIGDVPDALGLRPHETSQTRVLELGASEPAAPAGSCSSAPPSKELFFEL